jgi:uncharacterized surface protein with fasciclin (FAS1) repeats
MSENKSTTNIIILVVAIIFIGGGILAYNSNRNNTIKADETAMMQKKDDEVAMMKKKADEAATMKKESETVMVGGAAMYPNKDIISNVSNASNLTTLVTAVKAADLVTTLQGPGPFTVFGPTNAAFAKLPAGTVETLVKPENKTKLASILTYHVVSGTYKTSDLKDGQILKTVNGQELKITTANGKTMVNGAIIETPNVLQSNGVAHVIDTVLIPTN